MRGYGGFAQGENAPALREAGHDRAGGETFVRAGGTAGATHGRPNTLQQPASTAFLIVVSVPAQSNMDTSL